jgi:putative photosynthetic complex assembly protein
VWFCDLSDAEREAEVLDAVSWSLGLSPPPDAPPEEAWRRCVEAAHWRGGLLLVLDNAEGVVEIIDRLVVDLVAGSPKVRVVVTTQHSLSGPWPERELLPLADPASRVLLSARAFELGADLGPGADEATGELVASVQGEQGFLRGALRALSRERRARGLGPEQPFELIARPDGRLTLVDPVTEQRIDLESFGPTNAGKFATLLGPAPRP